MTAGRETFTLQALLNIFGDGMKIVYDKDLKHINVIDSAEPLIDLKSACKDIKIMLQPESRKFFKGNVCLVRESVAAKLMHIQNNLAGMRLVVCSGYRPLELQKKMYDDFFRALKKRNWKWNEKQLHAECSKFLAPVEEGIVPPHSTGGAVDITLEKSGKLLNMGTKLGDLSMKSAMNARDVSKKARENRKLLSSLMQKAGFVNYPLEWWHWSYGDRTWAYYKQSEISIYNSVPYSVVSLCQ